MCQISGIDHLFRRHVKPKKQHEIKLLGEVSYSNGWMGILMLIPSFQIVFKLSQLTGCRNIIVSQLIHNNIYKLILNAQQ